jgi:general secretion pathway protein D
LNVVPPQVNIKAKFLEVTQDDNRALGFDWYLGNILMGNGRVGAQGGTAPTFNGPSTTANPGGSFPGNLFDGNSIFPSGTDALLTQGLRNGANAPALGTITGILTDPQFRMVLRALDQRQGVDLLSAPEVTTLSGRQAQVQITEIRTIVTGLTQNANNNNQTAAAGGAGTVVQAASPITQNFNTSGFPLGPVLDVIPYVSADGFTVQMTIIPTITEFVNYDDPGLFVPAAITSQGSSVVSVLPLPRFRVRQVVTSVTVWDGQTVVLGGLISEDVTRIKDKVPVLGDLPLVGKLFRSESSQTRKKNLMIFVTPTIIDPSGNRAHSDDELPFTQSAIPPQASAK